MADRFRLDRWFLIALVSALPPALPIARAFASDLPPDCSQAPIPDQAAAGVVAGKKFLAHNVSLSTINHPVIGGIHYDEFDLFLHDQDQDNQDIQVIVNLIVPEDKLPDGHEFRRLPTIDAMKQPKAGPGAMEVMDWSIEYDPDNINADATNTVGSVRVLFGTRTDTTLSGKIYLCAPDVKDSYVAGNFSIDVSQ